jgi:hypothetical protein
MVGFHGDEREVLVADDARQLWYSSQRQRRFARFF